MAQGMRHLHQSAWKGPRMENKQVPEAASKESQMRFALAKLSDEDIRLRRPLLEAASVAARLALDLGSDELHEEAAKAWVRIDYGQAPW